MTTLIPTAFITPILLSHWQHVFPPTNDDLYYIQYKKIHSFIIVALKLVLLADSFPFFIVQLKYYLLCEAGTEISPISQTKAIFPSIFASRVPWS